MDGFDGELQASSPMTSAIMAAFPEGVELLLRSGHPLTEASLMFAVNLLPQGHGRGKPARRP